MRDYVGESKIKYQAHFFPLLCGIRAKGNGRCQRKPAHSKGRCAACDDVSVLAGFEAKWVSENWREHWTLCFWSFSYSASSRVSGAGTGVGIVEKLPFLFYHTRIEPPLPVGFSSGDPRWQERLCAVHKAIQGYIGQYGRIRFCINAHNSAGHRLQSPLRAFRRGGEEMS